MMKKSAQAQIQVSVTDQRMRLLGADGAVRNFPVSTSAFGIGFKEGSMKTPLGRFRIAKKIGAGLRIGTVFKSRKPVSPSAKHPPDADLIVSRILWLDGLGRRNANSYRRFIYIHGTNHEDQIGEPASHGCVRMKNADVVELFDLVEVGALVVIARESAGKRTSRGRKKALRHSA